MSEKNLDKHSLHPLTPEEKEEQEIDGPFSMLGYKLALCSKGDGSPVCVRYREYDIPTQGKKIHIICPSKDGCGQVFLHSELENPLECTQKGVRGVIVSAELQVPEIIKNTSKEYTEKFNKLIKKLPFRKRL